jgi:hypothetical protein
MPKKKIAPDMSWKQTHITGSGVALRVLGFPNHKVLIDGDGFKPFTRILTRKDSDSIPKNSIVLSWAP